MSVTARRFLFVFNTVMTKSKQMSTVLQDVLMEDANRGLSDCFLAKLLQA